MQILGFIVFLNVSHLGVMQIFRLTTCHAYFCKAIPLLILYGAGVAWVLFALGMHPFFLWQLILASIWLFVIGRKQTKMAEAMLSMAGEDADSVRLIAVSTVKTIRYYTYSSFVYVAVFSGTYIWLYNT